MCRSSVKFKLSARTLEFFLLNSEEQKLTSGHLHQYVNSQVAQEALQSFGRDVQLPNILYTSLACINNSATVLLQKRRIRDIGHQ